MKCDYKVSVLKMMKLNEYVNLPTNFKFLLSISKNEICVCVLVCCCHCGKQYTSDFYQNVVSKYLDFLYDSHHLHTTHVQYVFTHLNLLFQGSKFSNEITQMMGFY